MNRRQLLALTPALLAPVTCSLKPAFAAPRQKNPAFKLLEIEGATVLPRGINNNGDIAGTLLSDAGQTGFVLKETGEVTLLAVPGALFTSAWGIDDDGSVVGFYVDEEYSPPKGFLWQNGQFTTLIRDAETVARGISQGQVVGLFSNGFGYARGFVWENGQFTDLDFPGTLGATIPYGIHEGRIVGRYDSTELQKGFIYENGQFESLSFPQGRATEVYGVSRKAILGAVNLDNIRFRPFVLTHNRFQLLDLPGTNIYGINDEGQIVGDYGTGNGFVANLRAFITKGNRPARQLSRLLDPLGANS